MAAKFTSQIILLISFLLLTILIAQPIYAQSVGQFEEAPCPVSVPVGAVEGETVICGYVTVPEEHSNPDGNTIQIAVAVLKSLAENPRPDPVVMAQGGPGASSLETFMQFGVPDARYFFWSERDIIIIEQRGTLHSRPSLTCDELTDDLIASLDTLPDPDELWSHTADIVAACRMRLQDEGVNLAAFNSLENAADYPFVLEALGYTGKWNYYGVSYGTMLGQHIMRDHGENLRSVILDSTVPLEINAFADSPQSADRVFRLLFAACMADTVCNLNYPYLDSTFFNLVDDLNESPITFPLADPDTGYVYMYTMDGNRLIHNTFLLMYNSYYIQFLPSAIVALAVDGDVRFFQAELPNLLIDRTITGGMQYSVICSEDADFVLEDILTDDIYPQLSTSFMMSIPSAIDAGCAVWEVDDLGTIMDEPIISDIPTLILAGEFDPITPPEMAEQILPGLSNGYLFRFPGVAHGVISGGLCPITIMDTFIADPTQAPDSSCIDEMEFRFVLPDSK